MEAANANNRQQIARTLLPVATGAGCMVTLLIAMTAITDFGHPTPHIGDIVSFIASSGQPVDGGVLLTVQRPDQFFCELDMNILRNSGGSVVVEKEVYRAPGSFNVHWAGARTAAGSGNCGTHAELILDTHQLDLLAAAAGPKGALFPVSQNGT
jgi:hypothetical protein